MYRVSVLVEFCNRRKEAMFYLIIPSLSAKNIVIISLLVAVIVVTVIMLVRISKQKDEDNKNK